MRLLKRCTLWHFQTLLLIVRGFSLAFHVALLFVLELESFFDHGFLLNFILHFHIFLLHLSYLFLTFLLVELLHFLIAGHNFCHLFFLLCRLISLDSFHWFEWLVLHILHDNTLSQLGLVHDLFPLSLLKSFSVLNQEGWQLGNWVLQIAMKVGMVVALVLLVKEDLYSK